MKIHWKDKYEHPWQIAGNGIVELYLFRNELNSMTPRNKELYRVNHRSAHCVHLKPKLTIIWEERRIKKLAKKINIQGSESTKGIKKWKNTRKY